MRFEDWIRRSVLTRIALMLPLAFLALIPLVRLTRTFFTLPLSFIILASAAFIAWIIWQQQPRAVLSEEKLLLEAYETLPEAGVLHDVVSKDAVRLIIRHKPSVLPARSIAVLTLTILISWYAVLFTLGMTWHDLLTRIGIHVPEDSVRDHALRRMDIPARMPAAVTGSMDTSRIRSTPLTIRQQETPPMLPESFWLTLSTGGETLQSGIFQGVQTTPHTSILPAEPTITPSQPADPIVTAYYARLLQPD